MIHLTQNNDDLQQQNNADTAAFIPNQSIRFAFPERPLEQDYLPSHPQRTATMTSLGSESRSNTYHCDLAELPFFIASLFSIFSTFLTVRALVINGYLVDHSSWDGTGHHYDQQPVGFLNGLETSLVLLSLACGFLTCLSLVLKVIFYSDPLSSYRPVFAFINASCLLSTSLLFNERTFELVKNPVVYVYSRGFYSCITSGMLMLVAFCGFFCDWMLDSPDTGPLTIILKAMIIPSVMYCCTLIIGTLIFMQLENWEYSQAMMFCATALTTIGYGDVVPTTSAGRIFFLIYATLGIGVVGYFLLSLRAVIINGSSANLIVKVNLMRVESLHQLTRSQRQRQKQRQFNRPPLCQQKDSVGTMSCTEHSPLSEDIGDTSIRNRVIGDAIPVNQQQLSQHQSIGGLSTFSNYTIANILNDDVRQKWVHIVTYSGSWRMAIIFALSWFGGAAIFSGLEEDWTYLDALYFSFATQLTIGFGDLVPQTAAAQEFWFIYIIISIAVAAYFISMLGDILAQNLLIDNNIDDTMNNNDGADRYAVNTDRLSPNLTQGTADDHRNSTANVGNRQRESQNQEPTSSQSLPMDHQTTRPYDYGTIQPRQAESGEKKNKHSIKYSKHLPLAVTGAHCY